MEADTALLDLEPAGSLLTPVRVPDDEEMARHRQRLDTYGYTRIEGILLPAACRRLIDLVELAYRRYGGSTLGRPSEWESRWVYNLQNKARIFIDLLSLPPLETLLMERLNDPYHRFIPLDRPNYCLGYYTARSSSQALQLHIDSNIPAPGPLTWSMQVGFVLEPSTRENGCSLVVPGSHRSGSYTDRSFKDAVPVEANTGDLVMWDSRLWHGSGANSSGLTRWVIFATFRSWFLKSTYDIPRGLPEALYHLLTQEQKALLGYCAVPPRDEFDGRTVSAGGYEHLRATVRDYYR